MEGLIEVASPVSGRELDPTLPPLLCGLKHNTQKRERPGWTKGPAEPLGAREHARGAFLRDARGERAHGERGEIKSKKVDLSDERRVLSNYL